MNPSLLTAPPIETLADLLHRLGDVPPERIRLRPPLGTASEPDVVAEREGASRRLCELVDGVLVEKAMGLYEARLALVLGWFLESYLGEHDLGIAFGADGPMRLEPGLVRIPDVAYLSWDRLPDGRVPQEPIPEIAPDLAVEVLSPSNTPREMQRKLHDYFRAGVRLVWYIDPETSSATVYTAPDQSVVVPCDGTLDGGDVLPGFRLPLQDLFARADRPGAAKNRGTGAE